jgi:hypothetical protein
MYTVIDQTMICMKTRSICSAPTASPWLKKFYQGQLQEVAAARRCHWGDQDQSQLGQGKVISD